MGAYTAHANCSSASPRGSARCWSNSARRSSFRSVNVEPSASDLEGHIRRLARIVDPPQLVLVAYADFEVAAAPEPLNVVLIAETVAIAGILLDTYDKEGPGLTSLMNAHALASFVNRSKKLGRMVALAGQLTFEDIDTVCDAGADVIGIRGTACEGGRSGIVAAHRVREFRNQLDRRAVAAGTAAFRAI